MTDYTSQYFDICIDQIKALRDHSSDAINQAAQAVADAIEKDKSYFLFGSGHSSLVAKEAYWRAGGLGAAHPIPDPMDGCAERLPNFAPLLLAYYDLQEGSVIVIISNSGINPLPVDVALECKARGLTVIAITCMKHSENVTSRHPEGKKLYEVADIVIDTQGVPGDCTMEIPGIPGLIGPTSTMLGIAIVEAISVKASSLLVERGLTPPVLISANLPEGDAHNKQIADHYRRKLVRHEIPSTDAVSVRKSQAEDEA